MEFSNSDLLLCGGGRCVALRADFFEYAERFSWKMMGERKNEKCQKSQFFRVHGNDTERPTFGKGDSKKKKRKSANFSDFEEKVKK